MLDLQLMVWVCRRHATLAASVDTDYSCVVGHRPDSVYYDRLDRHTCGAFYLYPHSIEIRKGSKLYGSLKRAESFR